MSARRRGLLYCAAALVTATATTVAISGAPDARAEVGTRAASLLTLDNNIENWLPTECAEGSEYERLIAHLKKQPAGPDVFTVQQISNAEQLDTFTQRLTDELPGTYEGRIAIPEPGSMGYEDKPCGVLKNQQTNAVVYRSDRLTPQQETRWRSDAPANPKPGTGPCRNLEPTESSQDRVHNLAVRFHDATADKDVTVASAHWPTGTWHGPDCAAENMKETAEAVDRLGGDLRIIGVDTNAKTSDADWWDKGVGLGFRDPIGELCGGADCPDEHNTTTHYRIDFLLAKGHGGFSESATLTDKVVGGKYSHHRAVTSRISY
ncbi:hypothetical protein [Streptomyces sp. NPDC005438]|uniref:hypothetical protein n=1 Tax=Streptomyces sp. NPDC005438 TaxID=3156880 RepID=UPI00339E6CC8